MATHYEYHLHTGSGWIKAILTFFEDETSTLYFDSRWMGQDPERYKVTWARHAFSQSYGLLLLQSIERYSDLDSQETTLEDLEAFRGKGSPEDEERPDPIVYEYILLPQSEPWIAEEATLEQMRQMGYAWWHAQFDLVLLQQSFPVIPEPDSLQSRVGKLLDQIDKMKFKAVTNPVFGYTNPWPSPV